MNALGEQPIVELLNAAVGRPAADIQYRRGRFAQGPDHLSPSCAGPAQTPASHDPRAHVSSGYCGARGDRGEFDQRSADLVGRGCHEIAPTPSITWATSSLRWITARNITSGPTGCSWNSNEVTTPKLPPPPRTAQKRSLFSAALAVRSRPSAVTISTDRTLSRLRPCLPRSQPRPPAAARPRPSPRRRRPALPGRGAAPRGRNRPSCAAFTPRPRRALGSTRTAFIRDRSIMMPPSHEPLPAELWPPQRTADAEPVLAREIDRVDGVGGAVAAGDERGFLSNMAFQMSRAPR